MSSVIKINACVYSRMGYGREKNTNSFYLNGKFTSEQHIDNVQASMENRGTEYLFSLADNMNCSDDENDTHISILKEISRYHEKITVNGGDLKFKIKELETRITDISRLLASFLEMNRVPSDDPRWGIGFGSILISNGQFVAATAGNCRIFMMRDGMFRPLAGETSRAKRMLDAMINPGESVEGEDVILPDENPDSTVVISDIYDVAEGDSFLICSNGLFDALGEEKVEDILSLRSDSSYIAFRMVDEAMKRTSSGDLTAMVVQVERRYEGLSSSRRTSTRSTRVKSRVERLNKAPAVTYKYNRKRGGRYQGTLFMVMVIATVGIAFGIIYLIINSLINTGKEPPDTTPTSTATATPTPTYTPTQTPDPTSEPPLEETPTPEPTQDSGEVKTHTVVQGDTISKIARTYYGSSDYGPKLCEYNGISDPNKIIIGQKIKIPPVEMLR